MKFCAKLLIFATHMREQTADLPRLLTGAGCDRQVTFNAPQCASKGMDKVLSPYHQPTMAVKARAFRKYLIAGLALFSSVPVFPAIGDDWGALATVSSTMGVSGGRLCIGEASRGDIGCPAYAPSVTTAGDISVTGSLQAVKFIGDGSQLTNLPYPSGTAVISGTTTMVSGWPDAISCNLTNPNWGKVIFYPMHMPFADGRFFYRSVYTPATDAYDVIFNANGTFNSYQNVVTSDCLNKSISTLYAEGKAFNFIGGSGNGAALGDRLTSGTLAVTTNSATGVVSLSTAGTTWGYFGSAASYLPNLNAGSISTTNISISTINGVSAASFGDTPVAFSVHKNGVNQTVTAGVGTKLTWSTEAQDTNNNFASDKFTATIPGTYLFNASVVCDLGTACYVHLYKNGGIVLADGTGSGVYVRLSHILSLNVGDTVEVYAQNTGGTGILGNPHFTRFTGALINAAGGSGGDSTPTGAIMAFDLASCPAGWSEYAAARGRFLRGIDNGTGNDPSGTRVAGNTQNDALASHNHKLAMAAGLGSLSNGQAYVVGSGGTLVSYRPDFYTGSGGYVGLLGSGPDIIGTTTASETRPKNVAVLYCRKD